MGVITTGQTFSSGDQVTATKLNDIANNCTFTSAADTTDNSTLTLGSSKLKVKDAGISATQLATDSVITAKIQDGAVTSAKLDATAISAIMPTGSVIPFAGTVLPGNSGDWLFCDGSAQNQQVGGVNTALFNVIGTTYGGSATTFLLPDLRGRVVAGQDDMGGISQNRLTTAKSGINGDNLGATGGLEDHQLTIAEMPEHTHTQTLRANANITGGGNPGVDRSTTSVDTGLTGGDGFHNNVQPTIILNYIIKT
tara:strand:+ start:2265 stop:3023 length:759 start_codon:yes stop_codon:yes gene_type:complete